VARPQLIATATGLGLPDPASTGLATQAPGGSAEILGRRLDGDWCWNVWRRSSVRS
jgi:hypothetical protein